MYDLATDPLEIKNLTAKGYARTEAEEAEFIRLQAKLAEVEATRLQPLASS